jgi:quercetin dioxygenase-like cupin family protein
MINIRGMIGYSEGGILSKIVHRAASADITLFCMAGGTEISDHTSTREGFVYVVEGKGVFRLEGRNIPILPGAFIAMPKNAVHSLSAEENTSFILALSG